MKLHKMKLRSNYAFILQSLTIRLALAIGGTENDMSNLITNLQKSKLNHITSNNIMIPHYLSHLAIGR